MAKPPAKNAHTAKPAKPSPPAAKNGKASKNGNHGGKAGKAATKPAPKSAAKAPAPAPAPAPVKPESKATKARTELNGKIVHLIAEEMAIEEAELVPTASFREDLNLDEIDVAELLMQAENAFNVHPFSESDWDSCETVDDFVQLVAKRVEAKRGKKSARD
jgi:acyl carrier protein